MNTLEELLRQRRVYDRLDFWEIEEWKDWLVYAPQSGMLAVSNVQAPNTHHDSSYPVTWLRWFAIMNGAAASATARTAMEHLREVLVSRGVCEVWCITRRSDWIHNVLPECQFALVDRLITLQHNGKLAQPAPRATVCQIRSAKDADIACVAAVDRAAFAPPLHYGEAWLRRMRRFSHTFTVALSEGEVVGYQLTTRHFYHNHMVRLAVHPVFQRQGIGRLLLVREIARLQSENTPALSLNVMASNTRALQLYVHLGFRVVDEETFVWRRELC